MNPELPDSGPETRTPPGESPEGFAGERLHPSSMIFEAVRFVKSWVSAAAIPGIAALFGSGLSWFVIALIITGAVVLVILAALWGFLSWRVTTYSLYYGAFHLRRGVLQKSERTIPLDHVQSVDTVQGFIQRALATVGVLDVVEVRIETAGGGSGKTDASLSSLTRRNAESLRSEIASARRDAAPQEETEGPALIRSLTTKELLIAGATSGQIGAAAAILAFASQYFDNVVDRFFSKHFVEGVFQSIAPHVFLVVALGVFAVGLFAWALAIAGTVISYAGFTLSRSADGKYLHIKRGLFKRYEATVPISRIQAVRSVEGLLRQPFGLAMLRVESAGYGAKAEDSGVSTTLFPLLPREQARSFIEEVAPEFAAGLSLKGLPRRALRRYIFRSAVSVVVVVAAAGALLSFTGILDQTWTYYLPVSGVLLALSVIDGVARFRAAGWALEDDRLTIRYRTLGRTTAFVPRRRLQSRSVVSSPFQRRRDLATLRTRVASGSGGTTFEIVDLEALSARSLAANLGPR